jgi:superfamily II DNA/RNA helicase
MLKLGFQEDVEKIFDFIRRHLHHQPQTLLFSATVPAWVESIANKFMKK